MQLLKKATYPLLMLSVTLFLMTSCSKEPYKKYNDGEVVEDNFTGNINVTSTGSDPAGDFTGNGDAGTYSFAWENSKNKAHLNFDITSPSGSVQITLQDARGEEVLNKTLIGGSTEDTFSGVSEEGVAGTWLVTIILTDFKGDGSYSLEPRD